MPTGTWKDRRATSGGHLFDHMHEIDLLHWFVGDVRTVLAWGRSFVDPDRDDTILVTLEFENGALGIMAHGQGFRIGETVVAINGSYGAVRIDSRTASILVPGEGKPDVILPLLDDVEANHSVVALFRCIESAYGKPGAQPWAFLLNAFRRELQEFVAVVGGQPIGDHVGWLLDPHHGRAAVAVAEAAVESARTQRQVWVTR